MKIEIVWTTTDPKLTAIALAGSVGNEVGTALLAKGSEHTTYYNRHDWHLFELNVSSLNEELVDGKKSVAVYMQVQHVEGLLRKLGLTPTTFINHRNMIQYAASQEQWADFYKNLINGAIEKLRNTRRWFKDSRIAEIRQHLEQTPSSS